MNLYEFSKAYLENQTRINFPEFDILELDRYYDSILYQWHPYFVVNRGEETINEIMKMFAMILQNRFNLSHVINFEVNYCSLKSVTRNFDVSYLSNIKNEELYSNLNREIGFGCNNYSWALYCDGLIDSAKYLAKFNSYINFDSSIRRSISTRDGEYTLIANLCAIKGIGPVLARDFLKEVGYKSFGKPDRHLMSIFRSFDQSIVNDHDFASFDISIRRQSNKAGVTPCQLDRVLWMICSGKYYMHNLRINCVNCGLRTIFIKELTSRIRDGEIEI